MKNRKAETKEIVKEGTKEKIRKISAALKSMKVRHATTENITAFLLECSVEKYTDTDKKHFDGKAFIADMASAIRKYTLVDEKIEVPDFKL